jgi:hypothetical protein
MFSAYTIKKVLPRLLIAVILIQISWWLTTTVIAINNDIAHGIEALFYAPFGGIKGLTINEILATANHISVGEVASIGIFGGAAAGVGFIAAGASSLLGIFALALTAVIGAIIAVFTLVLRRAVLIMLIVISPLAVAAWVLPGTEKIWKIWYESFSKLLLMYPLIMLMIASGKIFAKVSADMGGMNQFAQFAMIIMGFFGPLLLIPATLKLSGGAFSALSGAMNNRGKGVFDRLKGVRANEAQRNWANTKAGNRFKGSNRVTARMNRIGFGVASGTAGGFGVGKRGANYKDEFTMTNSDELMKTQAWRGNMFKDSAMRALTYGSETEAQRELKARVQSGKMEQSEMDESMIAAKRIGYGVTSQVAAARQLAINKTGFEDSADAMETIERVTGNNGVLGTSLKENIKYTSKGVGRHDLGNLSKQKEGESRQAWADRMTMAGAQTADGVTLGRDHKESVKNITAAAKRVLDGGGSAEDLANAERVAAGLGSSGTYATLGNLENAESLGNRETGGTVPVPAGQSGTATIGEGGTVGIDLRNTEDSRKETYADRGRRGATVDPDDPRIAGDPDDH